MRTGQGQGIAARGIVRRFGRVEALAGVGLDAAPGEVHALLGENGAGKTTLLSILSGALRPDAGTVSVDGRPVTLASPAVALRLGVGTVRQHQTLVPTLTVAENLALGDEGGFLLRREEGGGRRRGRRGASGAAGSLPPPADDRPDLAGLDLPPADTLVGGLDIGARQRVEIAKALRRGTRALLLDEPTAVLAPAEVDALLALVRRLADGGRAVVLVTHKLDEAVAVADRVTVLRAGAVALAEPTAPGLRGRIVEAMFGGVGQSDSRTVGQSERDGAPGERGARAHPVTGGPGGWAAPPTLPATTLSSPSPTLSTPPRSDCPPFRLSDSCCRPPLLTLDAVSARDDRGALALDRLSLELRAGEILGVAGVEGNGQREFAEVIAGQRRPEAGTVRLDGEDVTALGVAGRLEAGVAFLTDERLAEGVVPGASVAMNLALKRLRRAPYSRGLRLDRAVVRHRALAAIAEHGIRPADPARDIATLSGGNVQRALVARELALRPRVLVASKPTAGLDLRTAERVLGLLRAAAAGGAAVLLISNELDELLAVADRLVVMYRGRVALALDRPEGVPFDRAAVGRAMLTGRPDPEDGVLGRPATLAGGATR